MRVHTYIHIYVHYFNGRVASKVTCVGTVRTYIEVLTYQLKAAILLKHVHTYVRRNHLLARIGYCIRT